MPLDPAAVQAADARLHAAHPELAGRALTMSPYDAVLRREWLSYYTAAAAPPPPPPPAETPQSIPPDLELAPTATAAPVQACEEACTDDAGSTCNCCDLTTVTFYVQIGESPASIVASYAKDKIFGQTPQPNTGHTFLGIGEGALGDQRAYGFYPATSWFGETGGINTNDGFFVPGAEDPNEEIYAPENEHAYTHQTSFKACPAKVEALEKAIKAEMEKIRTNAEDAPKYDLRGLQCTTWAEKHLSTLGFTPPESMSPHGAAGEIDEAEAQSDTQEESFKAP